MISMELSSISNLSDNCTNNSKIIDIGNHRKLKRFKTDNNINLKLKQYKNKSLAPNENVEVYFIPQFLEKYDIIEQLGKGYQGKAYKILDKETNEFGVAKVMNLADEEMTIALKNELSILQSLSHINLPTFLSYYESSSQLIFITKYHHSLTLDFYMNQKSCSLHFIKSVIFQLLQVLTYLHAQKIMHRDIKPSNILVCQTFTNCHKPESKAKTQETIQKLEEVITENKNEERSDSTEEINSKLDWLDKEKEITSSSDAFLPEIKPSKILFSFATADLPKDEILEIGKIDDSFCPSSENDKSSGLISSAETEKLSFVKVQTYPISFNEKDFLNNLDLMQNEKYADIVIKLIDFGVSKKFTIGEPCFSPNGDPSFHAPEIRKEEGYDHTIDLWGVGLIFLGLLRGAEVGRFNFMKMKQFELTGQLDKNGLDLLQRLLSLDPSKRGEAKDAIKHEWFRDINYM